jgi:nicotinamidase-related amidase
VSLVYLFHFQRRYEHAQHYVGFTEQEVRDRLAEHLAGQASPLMRAARGAGIPVVVARVWHGADRNKERRLKRSGSAARYCPICKAARA